MCLLILFPQIKWGIHKTLIMHKYLLMFYNTHNIFIRRSVSTGIVSSVEMRLRRVYVCMLSFVSCEVFSRPVAPVKLTAPVGQPPAPVKPKTPVEPVITQVSAPVAPLKRIAPDRPVAPAKSRHSMARVGARNISRPYMHGKIVIVYLVIVYMNNY